MQDGPPPGKGLAGVLTATLLTQTLVSWSVLALAAIAPMLAETIGLPAILIGYQVSLVYAVGAATSMFAGGFVARFGGCRISQIALVCCALGAALATTSVVAGIALASVLTGLAHGLTSPASTHLLVRFTTARNRGFIYSLKQTGVPLGGVAAGVITPVLALLWGWQVALATLAPLSLLLAALLIRPRLHWDTDRRPDAGLGLGALREAGQVLAAPGMGWICLYAFCFGGIQLCVMTFAVVFAVQELGFGLAAGGMLLATIQASGVVGRIGWGVLADRVQNNRGILALIGVLAAGAAVGFALTGPQTPRLLIFATAVVFGLTTVGWNGVFIAEIVRISPLRIVGAAAGVSNVFAFAGVLVAPSAFIALHAWLGAFAPTYAFLALPALLGSYAALRSAAID